MYDLFNEDGHLTRYALDAAVQQLELDELSRLEIAEHLSFCDKCLSAYALLLSEGTLVSPPQTQAKEIMKRVKQRAGTLFFNRYARMSVAACLAVTLWSCGVFSFDYVNANNQFIASISATSASVSMQVDEWKKNLTKDFSSFFQNTNHNDNGLKGASSHEKK